MGFCNTMTCFLLLERSRCTFFCYSSHTSRDYRDGVLSGLGFFTCGAFVTHPALRPTIVEGDRTRNLPTQISVPLSACGLLSHVPTALCNLYQITFLISYLVCFFVPLILPLFPTEALTSFLWWFKNSPASTNTPLLHSCQHWLFADFFFPFLPFPVFALLMCFMGSSSVISQLIFTR